MGVRMGSVCVNDEGLNVGLFVRDSERVCEERGEGEGVVSGP